MSINKEDLSEAFEYLDELRESGRTNMFGASTYVVNELGWEKKEAREATLLWMETFDGAPIDDRVTKALNK